MSGMLDFKSRRTKWLHHYDAEGVVFEIGRRGGGGGGRDYEANSLITFLSLVNLCGGMQDFLNANAQ